MNTKVILKPCKPLGDKTPSKTKLDRNADRHLKYE